MRLTQQQLETHLWGAANILRGKTAGQDYKNYILSLMFYKRLCDQWDNETDEAIVELEREQGRPFTDAQKAVFRARGEHRFSIPEGAHWGDVLAVSTDIGERLTDAMRAVSNANDELRGVFTVDWNQPAPDGSGKKLIPNEVVHALVQHFDEIDLSNKSVPPDVLGRAYEYLIKAVRRRRRREDTRECLLAALRRLRDPDAAKNFEHNFKSLERLWEAIAPDPSLYEYRYTYNWLCGIYVAHRRRQRGSRDTYGELSAKTRQLIEENTAFVELAEALPVYKIDKDYITKLDELPTPADKAAALEAILTRELSEDDPGFTYRQLGERLQRIKQRKDASDEAAAERLRELQEIADEAAKTKDEPDRLNLKGAGEYELFAVLRAHAQTDDENYLAECARRMIAHLRKNQLLSPGWSNSKGGRMRVEQSLLVESWNPAYAALGFNPDDAEPPFLAPAVQELAKTDA
jgi:hypothetical protein